MKPRHLIWIRRATQVLFLGLFLFLLAETRLPQDVYLDYSRTFSSEAPDLWSRYAGERFSSAWIRWWR